MQGRLTLLLGPPGSGKSTLLQCLAGVCTDGKDGMKVTGGVTYNGEPIDSFEVGVAVAGSTSGRQYGRVCVHESCCWPRHSSRHPTYRLLVAVRPAPGWHRPSC